MPMTRTIPTNVTPLPFRYVRGSASGFVRLLMIGPTPANQYRATAKISQTSPIQGSARIHGAFFTRSGRVNRARTALMPGMIQLSDEARIVNQADATRLSLPSNAGSAFEARYPRPTAFRIAKFENSRKITAMARVATIAFAGARSRSETAPSHWLPPVGLKGQSPHPRRSLVRISARSTVTTWPWSR